MGTSTSKPAPLAPTFERMATWDLKSSRRLLQDYKDKDLDFGLDAQALAELLGGDKDWAESIIDAFRSPTGIINALAFVCGACLVSSGPALEKAGMIFDALDFDGTEQISMDEMTIAFLCCARGVCVMTDVGVVPSDEELESVTLRAYRDLNKTSAQSITKAEFTKWVIEFAGGTGAPPTREVTLPSTLEQFRVVPPTELHEEEENNSASGVFQGDIEPSGAQHDAVEAEELGTEEATQHEEADEQNESAAAVEQNDEPADQATKSIEPEYIESADTLPSYGEVALDGLESERPDAETYYSALNDEDAETECQRADVNEGQASGDAAPAYEPGSGAVDDSYDAGVETQDHHESSANTESDYPTFVADADDEDLQQETANQHNNSEAMGVDADIVAADESPSELAAAAGLDNDDLLYEQEEFAQETPRTVEHADAGIVDTVPDENPGIEEATENAELEALPADVQIEATTEDPEAVAPESNGGGATAEAVVVDEAAADDTTSPSAEEPIDAVPTSENAEPTEGGTSVDDVATVAETPSIDEDAPAAGEPTDLNAFDTYDYQQPQYDGSSGLPPPEPEELQDDSVADAAAAANAPPGEGGDPPAE